MISNPRSSIKPESTPGTIIFYIISGFAEDLKKLGKYFEGFTHIASRP